MQGSPAKMMSVMQETRAGECNCFGIDGVEGSAADVDGNGGRIVSRRSYRAARIAFQGTRSQEYSRLEMRSLVASSGAVPGIRGEVYQGDHPKQSSPAKSK